MIGERVYVLEYYDEGLECNEGLVIDCEYWSDGMMYYFVKFKNCAHACEWLAYDEMIVIIEEDEIIQDEISEGNIIEQYKRIIDRYFKQTRI